MRRSSIRSPPEQPYREWLDQHLVKLGDLPEAADLVGANGNGKDPVGAQHAVPLPNPAPLPILQTAFGYTFEELRLLLKPMAENGVEATGAMGTDTPLPVLSNKPRLLYDYFHQLFAQVTNPPIDSIREAIITSADTTIGSERNLLKPEPESCRLINLKTPVITNAELAKLKNAGSEGFSSVTLPMVFAAAEGEAGLKAALDGIFQAADEAIASGTSLIILSDRTIDAAHAPIPALLAVAGLHHHLIRNGTRTRVGLVLESGEPREVHHFATLIGYGCGAINPYLVFDTIEGMISDQLLPPMEFDKACQNFIKAVTKGVIKIASKIGISTIQSYRGAQIFEALGLNHTVVDQYFTWTASRIQGIGLDVLAEEALKRHRHAFPDRPTERITLDVGGDYQWRKEGEAHLFSPEIIHSLQKAVRTVTTRPTSATPPW
jgi:glutamate synthase (ferredoxin)